MHPTPTSTIQQELDFDDHHQPLELSCCTSSTDKSNASCSFYERIWHFVREKVLAPPRRKVRSASYSPQSSLMQEHSDLHATRKQKKTKKLRAKSCGHEYESGKTSAAERTHCAWQKSKMLQELQASVNRRSRGSGNGSPKQSAESAPSKRRQICQHKFHESPAQRPPIQKKCCNCSRLFHTLTASPQSSDFCSLDCKSTFAYLDGMQRFVDERISEGDAEENDEMLS
uniref:Uncharacterized protein n=1 Tax=Globisporangium ultimum (strain ATCC 200006 / CBS 805.95 / DAOM BR144) TaxID=431595 RepID=K3XBV5_GLOUD